MDDSDTAPSEPSVKNVVLFIASEYYSDIRFAEKGSALAVNPASNPPSIRFKLIKMGQLFYALFPNKVAKRVYFS